MIVFRISSPRYSDSLKASGIEARWNRNGQKVIYASGSRSLACLENIVHKSDLGLHGLFKTLVIEIPNGLKIEILEEKILPVGWNQPDNYNICQDIGSNWITSGKSAVLKVPSALVPQEHNFIMNPQHPDFRKIHLTGTEDFWFDARILSGR